MSRVWSTARGFLIEQSGPQRERYWLVRPDETVVTVYEDGSFSLEDDLYQWHYDVKGATLLKRDTTKRYGAGPDSHDVRVVIDDLTALADADAAAWRSRLPGIVSRYDEEIAARRRELAATDDRITRSFLAVLPPGAAELEFRRVEEGWGVSILGGPVFWKEAEWRWRGKDLHALLARAVRAERSLQSFPAVLAEEADWMWYADD